MLFSFLIFYYRLFAFGKILNRFLEEVAEILATILPFGAYSTADGWWDSVVCSRYFEREAGLLPGMQIDETDYAINEVIAGTVHPC